jgi:hypothetical protein
MLAEEDMRDIVRQVLACSAKELGLLRRDVMRILWVANFGEEVNPTCICPQLISGAGRGDGVLFDTLLKKRPTNPISPP